MTKKILLIVAIGFILMLLGFWVYLLLFGSPKAADDVFVDLGLKNPTTERPQLITEINKSNSEMLEIGSQLNQLTTRPVAGYVVTNRPSDRLRYAERGTGYIYEINFTTNIETRVVGNTVAKTTEAYFSPDGLLAVLVSEVEAGTSATIVTIPEATGATSVTTDLPDNLREIKSISSTTVNYLLTEDGESVAYSFNRLTGTARELWRIPLTDIKVWWETNKTYVINKPAPYLRGGVYEVIGAGQLIPVAEQGFSYTALINENSDYLIETSYNSQQKVIASRILDLADGNKINISPLVIPEKCTPKPNYIELWCGAMAPTQDNRARNFIKDWYMGRITSDDYLWSTNTDNQKTKLVLDFKEESGLTIDLINPKFNQDGSRLFFQNKIDGTLWLYNLTQPVAENEPGSAVPLNP